MIDVSPPLPRVAIAARSARQVAPGDMPGRATASLTQIVAVATTTVAARWT